MSDKTRQLSWSWGRQPRTKCIANTPTHMGWLQLASRLQQANLECWNSSTSLQKIPTETPVLLTILMHAQKLNATIVGEGAKPIITLDGDLYDRPVKIKDYKSKWCIRLGGLHTVMAALKCLGKYIEGSSLDIAFETSGVYGPAIVRQILEGRHIYRGIEAHTILLLTVFSLLLEQVFTKEEKTEIEGKMMEAQDLWNVYIDNKTEKTAEDFQSQVNKVCEYMTLRGVFQSIEKWAIASQGIQKFLINYIFQVDALLKYISALRHAEWLNHLSLHKGFAPYISVLI